jgi:hypothetical protein
VFAEKAGEAVGNFAFLPEGSVKEVVFLTCELVHDNSVGAIEFLPVAVFCFGFGDEAHGHSNPV